MKWFFMPKWRVEQIRNELSQIELLCSRHLSVVDPFAEMQSFLNKIALIQDRGTIKTVLKEVVENKPNHRVRAHLVKLENCILNTGRNKLGINRTFNRGEKVVTDKIFIGEGNFIYPLSYWISLSQQESYMEDYELKKLKFFCTHFLQQNSKNMLEAVVAIEKIVA